MVYLQRVIVYSFCLLNTVFVHSQSTICSSGNSILTTEGSISFTVGQVFYDIIESSDHSIYHGVQQPYEISVVTTSTKEEYKLTGISIFPNPTSSNITIAFDDRQSIDEFNIDIYNSGGSLVSHMENLSSKNTECSLSSHPPGLYNIVLTTKLGKMAILRVSKL